MTNMRKVTCPFCGYEMPVWYDSAKAACHGLFIKCKGRKCGKVFEIIIKKSSDK